MIPYRSISPDDGLAINLRHWVVDDGDLAQEAGVSRQLCNAYKNKDEVLRALIRSFPDDALTEIEAELGSDRSLGDQLDIVFEKMVLAGSILSGTRRMRRTSSMDSMPLDKMS
jgi:hypothetical protein